MTYSCEMPFKHDASDGARAATEAILIKLIGGFKLIAEQISLRHRTDIKKRAVETLRSGSDDLDLLLHR